ncbi:MAG: CCA tRNA nucleotidyltransferase [Sulfolobales archaeon]
MARREEAWRVAEEVLNRIRPREDELREAYRVYRIIRERLERAFPQDLFSIELYGSIAKGTAISGDLDLDIFILTPREYGREWIRENFLRLAKDALGDIPYEERYAEHPYLRAKPGSIEADIVPALKISRASEAMTAADRTPFHTEYVRKMLSEEGKDHVRLLKKFMKGVGVYGAEIRVGGFSGYVAELLVITYGGFLEVIERASRWRPPVVIIPPGCDISESDARRLFKGSPFILPDPVDSRRNAGAAVTLKTLSEFIVASKLYLANPSQRFFEPPEVDDAMVESSFESLRKRGTCVVILTLRLRRSAPDNIWGEIKSLSKRIYNRLRSERYPVLRRSEYWDEEGEEALIALELLSCNPSEPIQVEGPPAWLENSLEFIEKQLIGGWGFWVDDSGRLEGVRRRSYASVEDLIRRLLAMETMPRDIEGVIDISTDIIKIYRMLKDRKGLRKWIYSFLTLKPIYIV